jgi:hypothetical protein
MNQEEQEMIWIKDSLKMNKLRINESYKDVEFADTRQINMMTRDFIKKAKGFIPFARRALSLSSSSSQSDHDRLDRLSSLVGGLDKTLYSYEGRKMVHEYALLSKNIVLEIIDITCDTYERVLTEM